MSNNGDVRVVITGEDQTSAAFASAKSSAEDFGRAIGSVALAVSAAVGAFSALTIRMIGEADALNDLSQQLGMGVRQLAAYKLAAEQSGTSLDQVGRGIKSLAVNIQKHGDAFKKVGIDTQDADKAFRQLADVFAAMPDGMEKSALAVRLFGRSGQKMIPLLNLGSKGLDEAAEKSRKYADAMARLAPDADKFNDSLAELSLNAKAAGANIAAPLVRALNEFIAAYNAAAALPGNVLGNLFSISGDQTKNPSAAIEEIDGRLATLRKSLDGIKNSWTGKNASWFNADDVAILEAQIAYAEKQRAMLVRIRGDNGGGQAAVRAIDNVLLGTPLKAPNLLEKNPRGAKDKKSDLDRFLEKKQQSEIDDYYRYGGEENMFAAAAKNAQLSEQAVKKYDDALKKSAESLYAATDAGRFDKFNAELSIAQNAFDRGYIDQDKLDAINAKLFDVTGNLKDQKSIAQELGMTFTSAFEDAIVGGKKFSEVLKGLGDDIVRLLMRKNVTEPFAKAISDTNWSSLFSFNADGGVYAGAGISAYSGQVVSRPTVFPFASGIGLMGEAGPEAILPLKRGANGKLGVEGGGGNVQVNVINNAGGTRASARERNDGGTRIIDVMIEQVENALAGNVSSGRGPLVGALSASYGLNRAVGAY